MRRRSGTASGASAGSAPTYSGVCWCRRAACTTLPVCVCFLCSLRLIAALAAWYVRPLILDCTSTGFSVAVTQEDQLQGSVLLNCLKASDVFRKAAALPLTAAEVEATKQTPSRKRTNTQSTGGGAGGSGRSARSGGCAKVADIVAYKTAVADLLVLEKRLTQWYGKRSEALLEEVAQRLVKEFDDSAASHFASGSAVPSPAKAARSSVSPARRLPDPISEGFLNAASASVRQETEAIDRSLAELLNGRLPKVILDAERRKNPETVRQDIVLNDDGEEIVVLD